MKFFYFSSNCLSFLWILAFLFHVLFFSVSMFLYLISQILHLLFLYFINIHLLLLIFYSFLYFVFLFFLIFFFILIIFYLLFSILKTFISFLICSIFFIKLFKWFFNWLNSLSFCWYDFFEAGSFWIWF